MENKADQDHVPLILVPLAQGCEELEAITITDLLTRAGCKVITASLDGKPVKASRGITLLADYSLDEVMEMDFDMMVLPGGLPGADNLNNDARIQSLVKKLAAGNKYTAAICAAPRVLITAGVTDGKHITGYPGSLDSFMYEGITLEDSRVTVDGKVVTSRGPGTAMDFALTLISLLLGDEKRNEVEAGLVR